MNIEFKNLEYSKLQPDWQKIITPRWFLTDAVFYSMGLNPDAESHKARGQAVCTFSRNDVGIDYIDFKRRVNLTRLAGLAEVINPNLPETVDTKAFIEWARDLEKYQNS